MGKILTPESGFKSTVGSKMQELEARISALELAGLQVRNVVNQINTVLQVQGEVFRRAFESLNVDLKAISEALDKEILEKQQKAASEEPQGPK